MGWCKDAAGWLAPSSVRATVCERESRPHPRRCPPSPRLRLWCACARRCRASCRAFGRFRMQRWWTQRAQASRGAKTRRRRLRAAAGWKGWGQGVESGVAQGTVTRAPANRQALRLRHHPPGTGTPTCDAVGHEARQVGLADGLAGRQGAVPKHDVGLALLDQLDLAGRGRRRACSVSHMLVGGGKRSVDALLPLPRPGASPYTILLGRTLCSTPTLHAT